MGPFCQSCGMPLSRDEGHGGTENDGTKSTEFCSHCYQNGEFTQPDLTVDQMVENSKRRMLSFGVPEPIAEKNSQGVHLLKRWAK
ncbi:MAG: zinc ribbon domain-containing protein [Thaumarchaeota archaeon]|nr:zinc ribbon domain-containing protein [Nitrososphaerota archaeon]